MWVKQTTFLGPGLLFLSLVVLFAGDTVQADEHPQQQEHFESLADAYKKMPSRVRNNGPLRPQDLEKKDWVVCITGLPLAHYDTDNGIGYGARKWNFYRCLVCLSALQTTFVGAAKTVVNLESRWTFYKLHAGGQHFDFMLVPFTDFGFASDTILEMSFQDWRPTVGGGLYVNFEHIF